MHVLAESVERTRYIYPDGFRSETTFELVCSCGEIVGRSMTDPSVTSVWDAFEKHRKEEPGFKPDKYVLYPNQNIVKGYN